MKKILSMVCVIAAGGILYACGGGGSSSTPPTGGGGGGGGGTITTTVAAPAISTTPTTITTQTEAAKTVNASKTLASSFASGSAFPSLNSLVGKPSADQAVNGHRIISTVRDVQQRVAGLVEKQKSLGKRVAAVQSQACTDGGTMSFDQAANPLVLTFSGCKEGYEYQNGTVTMPQALLGQTSGSGGTLSVNMTTISYATGGYTTKQYESALNMTMTIGSFDTASGAANFSLNGSESAINYLLNTSEKMSFGNFSLNMTESTSVSSAIVSMTMDGSVSMDTYTGTTFTTIDTASGMTFRALKLVETVNSATSTSSLTIDGTYAIKTIPACMDGTFVISTQNAIVMDATGKTTAGKMTVNTVVMTFNSDGSVTATINGIPQTITSYANACLLSF